MTTEQWIEMDSLFNIDERKVAIIGLGYVGLPLAIEFAKHRPVMAFDIDTQRISALKEHHDVTMEVSQTELKEAKLLCFGERTRNGNP